MTKESDVGLGTTFYKLMIYSALFGALSSLLTVGYITLYNVGTKFFEQVSLIILNINIWPLILLTGGALLVGIVIKIFGQNGGLGVVQSQYSQTGRINPRKVPSILRAVVKVSIRPRFQSLPR